MTTIVREQEIPRRFAAGLRAEIWSRPKQFAFTVAVWTMCALIGAVLLQALRLAAR